MLTFINNEEALSKEEIEDLIKEKQETLKGLENFGKNSAYIKELSDLAFLQLEIELFVESE